MLGPCKVEPSVALDSDLCPTNKPIPQVTAILLDRTDPLTPLQAQDARNFLLDAVRTAGKFSEVHVYTVGSIEERLLNRDLRICQPGSPDNVNKWTAPIRKAIQNSRKFEKAIQTFFDSQVGGGVEDHSPIFESIKSVASSSFSNADDALKQLIIVSDGIQHSQDLSHYKHSKAPNVCIRYESKTVLKTMITGQSSEDGEDSHGSATVQTVKNTILVPVKIPCPTNQSVEPFRTLTYDNAAQSLGTKLHAALTDVKTTWLYVRRDKKDIQGGKHIAFWENFISRNGGTLDRVKSLSE